MMDQKLAATLVHDMKNSLALLEGELAALSAENPKARAAHVLCSNLRQKLVGFLTLYKGSLAARAEAVSPEDFLLESAEAALIAPGGPKIVVEAEGPQLWFFDERLVQLALDAAIDNAQRFASSRISLKAREDDDFLVFSVEDDGPGLGAEEAEKSTGLGTRLCEHIASAHVRDGRRGKVTLSDSPAGGARFELWLP